nr:immunoglobulin heavy chain junction region [Homo sapiens]
RFTISRDNAK